MSNPDLNSEGDEAARVPLFEAITAVLDELDDCAGTLAAIRYQLREQEPSKEMEIDEEDLPRPAEQASHIAARLESCAGAIRNASGERGNRSGI